MKSLKIIKSNFHAQYLRIRNINNLLQSDNFIIAYNASDKKEKDALSRAIERQDKNFIKFFIGQKLLEAEPFEQLPMKKLREIGQYLSIDKYHYLNKLSLVEEINNVIQRIKSHSNGKRIQSKETNYNSKNLDGCRKS